MQEKISTTTQDARRIVTDFLDTYPAQQPALPIAWRAAGSRQDEDGPEIDAELSALRADNRRLSAEIGEMHRRAKQRALQSN